MANWCSNIVYFYGTEEQLLDLRSLFSILAEEEEKTGNGQLPEFLSMLNGYFHYIRWDGDMLYYETKWCPNLEEVQKLAEYYCVDYNHDYDERSMYIYGQAKRINGVFSNVCLTEADFAMIYEDPRTDTYFLDDQNYGYEEEILDLLLERKMSSTII